MDPEGRAAVPEARNAFLKMGAGEVTPDGHVRIGIGIMLSGGEGEHLLLPWVHDGAPCRAHPREHDEAKSFAHADTITGCIRGVGAAPASRRERLRAPQ